MTSATAKGVAGGRKHAVGHAAGTLVAAALALLGLAGLGPGTALADLPGSNGQIAFDSDRSGSLDIHAMNADGSSPTRLTHHPRFDGDPAWSPGGQRIAFRSNRDGFNQIYVMNADGGCPARLTRNASFDGGPAWSPDGERIAFRSDRDGSPEIYVMNANGRGQTRLTDNPGFDGAPTWSPDGRIAFVSAREGDSRQIHVMNADGSNQTPLTHSPGFDSAPDWSPDGQRIAFDSGRDGNPEIYVMNADGSDQTRLTHHPRIDGGPAWSPDGRRIAFRSNRDGVSEIYVMNADGSGQTRLTNNPWSDDRRASWQPWPLPSNRFCFGQRRRNTKRGVVRQRVRVPGPGTVIVRRNERVRGFLRVAERAGVVGVAVRARGTARQRLNRVQAAGGRTQVFVRTVIAFRPTGADPRTRPIQVRLVRASRR